MFDRFVRFTARQSPYEIAASNGHNHVSYRRLDADVDRLAQALRAEGLSPGAIAGVCVADAYFHLLISLACARLRVATASLFANMAVATAGLTGVDVVIAGDSAIDLGGLPVRRIDADRTWIEAALAAEVVAPWRSPDVDPEALSRVQLSSGTTGTPKATSLSWRVVNERVLHTIGRGSSNLGRVLSLIGPESGAIQLFLSCWASEGCVLFPPADMAAIAAALPALAPNSIVATPVQLAALLAALPADAAPRPGLSVVLSGSDAPRGLLQTTRERLTAQITLAYASTEAGVCAAAQASLLGAAGAVGWAPPWLELQTVDDKDAPCTAGAMGRVRVRGSDVVESYRNDPKLTAERFRAGWFYPGDLGSIDADGLVTIHGREDEVMNFGGVKFLPEALEAPVRVLAGVEDVAAFALEDDEGHPQPWLAIVRGAGFDERSVGPALQLPALPTVRMAWIDALPRTPTGKVKREDLKLAARNLAKSEIVEPSG